MPAQEQTTINVSSAVSQTESHTLLETTETVADKMNLLTKQALPGGYDFYKMNGVKKDNN